MTIFATIDSISLSDSTSITIRTSVAFLQSGIGVNDNYNFITTPPTLLLGPAVFNASVRTAISNYIDSTYATSTTGADVFLMTGAI